MPSHALICTKNRYLGRKLTLELSSLGVVCTVADTLARDPGEVSYLFIDCDTLRAEQYPAGAFLLSAHDDGDGTIRLPLPLDTLASLIEPHATDAMRLDEESHTVVLFGTAVRLTATEFAMLKRLIAGRGAVVSKEELRKTLFEGDATPGAVSVYIHYLRQKLEFRGEKIILATRGVGYAIAEKYLPREDTVC